MAHLHQPPRAFDNHLHTHRRVRFAEQAQHVGQEPLGNIVVGPDAHLTRHVRRHKTRQRLAVER